ncbi:MAG: HipA domain-containing protein [Parabacteroides sp.]|nr:HipA domain-containing protein [Parabacteroides sp.]
MQFLLMSKDIPVCKLQMDFEGHIDEIIEILNEAYLPVGVSLNVRNSLYEWWKGRSIPASRNGLSKVLSNFDIDSTSILSVKSLGLSLTDQYWIKPVDKDIKWSEINFFDNEFSTDIGNAFFDEYFVKHDIDFMSPDNTSDGWLKKKWIIVEGDRCLVKTGSSPFCQEPFNEVIASLILSRLKTAPFVEYGLFKDEQQGYCSICKNFITKDTELVSAFTLNKVLGKQTNTTSYEHYMNVCKYLNIPDVEASVDTMLVVDYIIANKDRHGGNFGVIRDVETLRYIGPAPIYDSGTSLWYNQLKQSVGTPVVAQPFNSNHEEQVKLVKDWNRFDFSRLDDIYDKCYEILALDEASTPERNKVIIEALKERIESIKLIQKRFGGVFTTEFDELAIAKYKQFKYNHQTIFAYYLDKQSVNHKTKYNPEIDKRILDYLLKDGFSIEQCKKILINSPNLKSERMIDLLLKDM